MSEPEFLQTLEGAKRLLEHVLRKGTWVMVSEVRVAAEFYHISWRTMRRARALLPITVQKHGAQWRWQLEMSPERRASLEPRPPSLGDHLAARVKDQIH